MEAGFVNLLDAVYSLDAPERVWLDRLARQAAGCFPGCVGGFAYAVSSSMAEPDPLVVAGTPRLLEIPRVAHASLRSDELRAVYGHRPRSGPTRMSFRSAGRPYPATLERMWRGLQIADVFAITVPDPARRSVGFGLALDPARYPSIEDHDWRGLVASWDAIALHLAQAASLRGALERGDGEAAGRAGNQGGLWRWNHLLAGSWSVVRRRAGAGGMEYLAIRNPTPRFRRLTAFERSVVERLASGDSNRDVAAALDAHESSVSRALARALAKLGVRSRSDLILVRAALLGAGGERARG
jgi:DNA-binding CsgD family transcriptional regulator